MYPHSICKKPVDAGYSALPEEIESNKKAPKFTVCNRVKISKYKNIFSKDHTENWSREILFISSVFNANPWTYMIQRFE